MRLMKSAILFSACMVLVSIASPAQSSPKQQSNTPQSSRSAQLMQNFEFKTDISKMKIQVAKGSLLQAHDPTFLMQKPDTAFDQGIYARTGGNMCGAIVSYNFSPGLNPHLESITTCTPSNAAVQQRARGRKPARSNTPQLLQTDLRQND